MSFRLSSQSASTMGWIDPTNLTHIADVSWAISRKARLDAPSGRSVFNSKWTFRTRSVLPLAVPVGCNPCDAGTENISISTSISGSVDNSQKLIVELNTHIKNLQTIASDLVLGLPPKQDIILDTQVV